MNVSAKSRAISAGPFSTDEEAVTIAVDGQRVVGMFHRPVVGASPFPTIVIFHGFTGNKTAAFRKFVTLARRLAQEGIATLRFDYRGCGDSEGDAALTSIESERTDARAALAWLRQRPEVNAQRLAILGVSLGGMIAVETMAEDEDLKTGCLWAAVSRPALQLQIRATPELESALRHHGYAEVEGWPVGRAFVEQMATMNPLLAAERMRGRRMLLLHGERDQSVPLAAVWEYAQAFRARGNDVQVHVIPEADHRYSRLTWQEEIIRQTVDWFVERLVDGSARDPGV